MKRLLAIGILAAACCALVACGGGHDTPKDDGTGDALDVLPTEEVGGVEDVEVAGDEASDEAMEEDLEPDYSRDILQDFGGDEGADAADVEAEVPPDVEEAVDESGEECTGPWCVPCTDDGLPCTTEEHDPETGECVAILLPNFCLIEGACWFLMQPSPENPCLFCVPATAMDAFSPSAGLPCDDQDLCTSGDQCDDAGACQPGPSLDCNDSNDCTFDECDPRVGCKYTNRASTCDDHNACTYGDNCQNRVCTGYPLNCNDNNPCTNDSCEPAFGCLNVANTNPCNDNNACTENDVCTDKACRGTAITCDDHNTCTRDSCNENIGCVFQADMALLCTDDNACTTNDHCTKAAGETWPHCEGYARVCDDLNACTLDACDPLSGCVYTPYVPEVNPCAAGGDACTEHATCVDGACVGLPKDCDDLDACTIDSCEVALGGCQHVPNLGACDDGNPCTQGESCGANGCKGGIPTDCDDRNPCTTDDCVPSAPGGCVHTPLSGTCADPNPCSFSGWGTCVNGVCVSVVKDCDDGNSCTIDSCDASGACIHTINVGGGCEDGNACTVNEQCTAGGVCEGGVPRDCNDRNVCTIDECNNKVGCVYTPTPGSCSDGSVCTQNDQCEAGVCVGQPIICEDDNYCTDNECDPIGGCYYPPVSRPCDDDNICTIDDQCIAGACVGLSLFEDPSVKAGRLSIGVSGNPGQGVDVDGLETTCSPKGWCVQGIDNNFMWAAFLFNDQILKANTAGTLALLVEAEEPGPGPFDLNLFWGQRIAPASCDPTKPDCNYGVVAGDLQGVCEPVHIMDNATLVGTRLIAGGRDYQVPVYLVIGTHHVQLNLKWAKVQMTVSMTDGKVIAGAGALGGLVNRQEVIDGISAIPQSDFPPGSYTKDLMLQALGIYLTADFDADGDGVKESVSMGWPATLVSAHIIGPL